MKKNNFIFLLIIILLIITLSKLSINLIPTIPNISSINTLNSNLDYNKIPYISTYYFNFKPTINDDVIIPFYITNYEHSDYLDDTSVLINLEYELDGTRYQLNNIKSGDNSLNLGKLSEGEHYFALQAIDISSGLKSHKLYNEILVVNPETYQPTSDETYKITEQDLLNYKILNNNSTNDLDMTTTRVGLSKLFNDLKLEGYSKCILPKGIYRINNSGRYESISIPSNFTVDMNGSKFKLNTIIENDIDASIVNMVNTYDSHLINGILEGDKLERDYLNLNAGYNGEQINTISIKGGKYSSIENITIKQTTGHTITSVSENLTEPQLLNNFSNYLIIDNEKILDKSWSTSDMIDISNFISNDYITIGRYLGYRGVIGNSLISYLNFYDENKNFIETVVGYQYRKTKIPAKSKYIRVSLYGDISENDNACIFYNELGTNWTYTNIDFIDTRTTAIASATSNNLLINNCKFTRCGISITPSIVDFEDGWQECQDIYFRNNSSTTDAIGSNSVIDNSGYNHIYEDNFNIGFDIRYSVVGLVLRENSMLDSTWIRGYETGSKYSRISNNIINGSFNSPTDDSDSNLITSLIKDSTITCYSLLSSSMKSFSYKNCIIRNFNGSNIHAIDCIIYPSAYLGENLTFTNCTFYPLENENIIKMSFNSFNTYREFNNCIFTTSVLLSDHNQFNSGIFNNCTFEDDVIISPNAPNDSNELVFRNSIFKGDLEIDIKDKNCIIEFTNCTFSKDVIFDSIYQNNIIFN